MGTGTVEIKVTDINDNIPTLEKSEVRNVAYRIQNHDLTLSRYQMVFVHLGVSAKKRGNF